MLNWDATPCADEPRIKEDVTQNHVAAGYARATGVDLRARDFHRLHRHTFGGRFYTTEAEKKTRDAYDENFGLKAISAPSLESKISTLV